MPTTTEALHSWLRATCGGDSYREIARRAGLSDSIISRQIRDLGSLSFEVVVAIAREYGAPVLPALVANGLVTATEATLPSIEATLRGATEQQLVLEIARRLDIPGAHDLFDRPMSEAVEEATVTHLDSRRNVRALDDDEREVAFESEIDHSADTDDLYDE
ncbi:transcriptional regulator with XRE-family HTH domain [Microbacterium resistens]|uniref:Transcriptional regulator with XRE-family HTH domain n=1 Tax=Microbacterium resistens TaxID=156977 RepID=A0ABU1SE24_9MICO|nr:helix-turn-helix transcriptional regulator [Microbacterium resistens]MDR6867866.1 transcriptional regulator with XRE-family HTH domain [Microbacterium resistens]